MQITLGYEILPLKKPKLQTVLGPVDPVPRKLDSRKVNPVQGVMQSRSMRDNAMLLGCGRLRISGTWSMPIMSAMLEQHGFNAAQLNHATCLRHESGSGCGCRQLRFCPVGLAEPNENLASNSMAPIWGILETMLAHVQALCTGKGPQRLALWLRPQPPPQRVARRAELARGTERLVGIDEALLRCQ